MAGSSVAVVGRSRRPTGAQRNRAAILASARERFIERGYAATIREIAAGAEVDPALVHRYFGSKEELLLAALHEAGPGQLSIAESIPGLLGGDRDSLGDRLVRAIFDAYETPLYQAAWGSLVGLLRSATTHEDAASRLREGLMRGGLVRLLEALEAPQPTLRAALIGSELFGLAMSRYVVRIEPIASASVESLVAWYGPSLQRLLAEPLSDGSVPTHGSPRAHKGLDSRERATGE